MTLAAITALVAFFGLTLVATFWLARRRTRRRARLAQPFPPEWRTLLETWVPLYHRLPTELRQRIEPLVRAFIGRVRFVGCNELVVTDEMRLVIAFQACLLVVERGIAEYDDLMSVLIYPEEFVISAEEEDDAGVVTAYEDVASGQSHDTARILLSWRDIQELPPDGEIVNVVLHEFAHYLDHNSGGAFTDIDDPDNEALGEWHGVLESEFNAHCEAVEAGDETLIEPDGAEHPAEFFAYATEVFFEAPGQMKHRHPRLYEGLKTGYGLDPASW